MFCSTITGGSIVEMKEMEQKIEELRQKLNTAVKNTKGELRSPEVYELSRQLDKVITEYMELKKR
jgi:hypothetical protein